MTNASQAMRSSGAYEKERTARRAQAKFRTREFVDRAVRALRPYVRNARLPEADPRAQPRRNRFDSGSSFSASMTRRSSSEKSPASSGTET